MAANTLIDLDDQALLDRLTEAREELFNLRFQNATGQLSNTARLKQVRKEIARCLTEARAREITAAEALRDNGATPAGPAPAAERAPTAEATTDAAEAGPATADDGADE